MSIILKQPIVGPTAWVGNDFADEQSYIHQLTATDLADINVGLAQMHEQGKAFPQQSQDDLPLHQFANKLTAYADELENGRGFFVLRGLPLEQYSQMEIHAIYYSIGLHLGHPVGQNPKRDLLGAVENVADTNDKYSRVYETNRYLPYHTDPSDVVALLCLRQAKQGGLSSLVSAASIYNEILAQHSEHLGLYYKAYHYAHLCEDKPGLSPLFSYYQGKLSCRYLRQYIELGHEIMQHPLAQVELEALDIFDQIMLQPELRLDMMLQPGDMQFANNYVVLHSRTSFEDHEQVNQRRKLLRLWLKMPNARQLAAEFPGRNGFALPN